MQVSERVYSMLAQKLEGSGHNLLPPSLAPGYNRLREDTGTCLGLNGDLIAIAEQYAPHTKSYCIPCNGTSALQNQHTQLFHDLVLRCFEIGDLW